MKVLVLLIVCFFQPLGDTLQSVTQNIDFLYQLLLEQNEERLAEFVEFGIDEDAHEELIEDYLFYLENPININSEAVSRLEEIGLLSAFQTKALQDYRRQFGDLLLADELLMIEGFNETTVAVIAPLVVFGKSEYVQERETVTLGKALTRGRHQVTVNYAEKFGGTINEAYLGSPLKCQMKYAYHYKQKLRFGVVTEKDAGEPRIFDFVGAYGYASDLHITDALVVKDLALGDYQLSFGQGLTLWSGMSFGKGGGTLMRRGAGVRPKASAGEGKFFRGAATTLQYHDFYATMFYSNRRVDSLQETGYHRTENELAKRHAVRQRVFGGRLCYAGPHVEVGYTFYHQQEDRLTDMGVDFRWLVGKTAFFGELARSDNGAWAELVGMTMKPHGYINFSMLYRNYDQRYQSLFNGAFGESSHRQGEEGWYLGVQCAPAAGWDLLAYCDFFRLTTISSQVYSPSWGQEYSLKVTHQISHDASMQLRFKSKTKMKNSSDDHVFVHYPIFYTKRSLTFQVSYGITDGLTFSDKAAYTHYLNDDGADSRGYLLCHDIAYKPVGKPYGLTFRYALYGSDDYYSRISVYENDVLGAFSIPNLYGRGSRLYLLGQLKLFNSLSIYSRIGLSLLSEEVKADLKAEVVWKR